VSISSAFVGMACVIGVANLVMLAAVLRRLREHALALVELQKWRSAGPGMGGYGLPVGASVGEFTSTTVDGEPVSRDSLEPGTIVAFFSTTCGPCKELLPEFVDFVREHADRADVLAIVSSPEHIPSDSVVRELLPVTRVIVEEGSGPLRDAFDTAVSPSLFLIGPGGIVTASGSTMSVLRSHATVA
jgi:thiol-disulfide isomerase/thioredoxin